MLELYEYDVLDNPDDTDGIIAFLHEASQICVTKEINASDELTFEYPIASDKAELITVNRMILCDGQFYRVMRITRGDGVISAECMHTFFADAPAVHIPSVADSIGVKPYDLIKNSEKEMFGFEVLTQRRLESLGMDWIGEGDFMRGTDSGSGREFKIDFFALDKTNLLEFIKTVIENAGFGEIYYDNRSFAIAERLGKDTGIRLELCNNMENVSTEIDISSMVTRLYPYGCDDMTIESVYGQNYVDSPNMALYGLKAGYKDYSDYTNVNDLYYNALWEFDSKNPERIDVPSVSVSGNAFDLDRYSRGGSVFTLSLGDTVMVVDERNTGIYERVIALSCYPYESRAAEITIGRVKRDLYFYISQISELAKRYSKCSTTSGKISARSISGGRNAVYAALAGRQSDTVDFDEEGEG